MKQLIAGYKDLTPKIDKGFTVPVWFITNKQLYRGEYHLNGYFYAYKSFSTQVIANSTGNTGDMSNSPCPIVTHWCYNHEMTPDQLRRIARILEEDEELEKQYVLTRFPQGYKPHLDAENLRLPFHIKRKCTNCGGVAYYKMNESSFITYPLINEAFSIMSNCIECKNTVVTQIKISLDLQVIG